MHTREQRTRAVLKALTRFFDRALRPDDPARLASNQIVRDFVTEVRVVYPQGNQLRQDSQYTATHSELRHVGAIIADYMTDDQYPGVSEKTTLDEFLVWIQLPESERRRAG